jgi:hypothetical protein
MMLDARYASLNMSTLSQMALSSVKQNGCAAVPSETMREVFHSVARSCQHFIEAGG